MNEYVSYVQINLCFLYSSRTPVSPRDPKALAGFEETWQLQNALEIHGSSGGGV